MLQIRDELWLESRLRDLWTTYYSDVKMVNPIVISYGKRAKNRLGCIKLVAGHSVITINLLFADPNVPQEVVDATIVHELAHYAHGFGSNLPKRYADPHRGGVVDIELRMRGCFHLEEAAARWRKTDWHDHHISGTLDLQQKKAARHSFYQDLWGEFLGQRGMRDQEVLTRSAQSAQERLSLSGDFPAIIYYPASLRQKGTSYWSARERKIQIHGVLAHPDSPEEIILIDTYYWYARLAGLSPWPTVQKSLGSSMGKKRLETALKWRAQKWDAFREKHHPLRAR